MLEENENIEESDFKDFDDTDSDNIELDSDLSDADESSVEQIATDVPEATEEVSESENNIDTETVEPEDNASEDGASEEAITKEEAADEEIATEEPVNQENDSKDTQENKDSEVKPEQEENEQIQQASGEPAENVEISKWEELNNENGVVKKYIIYISKDFIPYIDCLNTDERSAYINDAIQCKLDLIDEQKQINKKKTIFNHFVVAAIVILMLTPFALLLTHKAIMATFNNYKYSQENFEKLYKQRFEKDKAYMRSLQYNKELEKKLKNAK